MADNKTTRSRRRKEVPYRRVLTFPQVVGKTVVDIELSLAPDFRGVHIRFQDKTSLTFDLEPCFRVTPELADWKSGDYKLIRQWRPVLS